MTIDTSHAQHDPQSFGKRMQTAREALGLERLEVAKQLKLNEKIIIMLEKELYAEDLPLAFIRGYITAYAKFLTFPETDIQKALEPIQIEPDYTASLLKPIMPESSNYFVQVLSTLILLTLIALVGTWWYTHPSTSNNENSMLHALTTSIVENEHTEAPKEVLASTNTSPIQSPNPATQAEDALPNNLSLETSKDNLLAENSINAALDALAMPVESIAKPDLKSRKRVARSTKIDPYDYNID